MFKQYKKEIFVLTLIGITSLFVLLVFAAVPSLTNVVVTANDTRNGTNTDWTGVWTGTDTDGDSLYNTSWFNTTGKEAILIYDFNVANATDLSGQGNNGTVLGGATWNPNEGKDGSGAYQFDGLNDNINITHSSSLTPKNAITVSMWVKPNSWRTYTQFILKTNSSSWSDGYGLGYLVTTNKIHFWVNDWNAYNVSAPINLNTWNYVVGTFNGSLISIYVDGALVNTKTHISTINYSTEEVGKNRHLVIGGGAMGSPSFKGNISEIRIYNYSLSAQQILNIYNNASHVLDNAETETYENWTFNVVASDGGNYSDRGKFDFGIKKIGNAYCWGRNEFGQLGIGNTSNEYQPTAVSYDLSFSSISDSYQTICGIVLNGSAYCWGNNSYGQLGIGNVSDKYEPIAVSYGLNFSSVSTGEYHTCGIVVNGSAYCWGYDNQGQLGIGNTSNKYTISDSVLYGLNFTSINAGYENTCSIVVNGSAYCWGSDDWGQLGIGNVSDKWEPIAVSYGLNFTSISADWVHPCGIVLNGSAYCWGRGSYGVLGIGNTSNKYTISNSVLYNLNYTSINTQYYRTCGTIVNGSAYCWGNNGYGQLGIGNVSDKYEPIAVSYGLNFSSVNVGNTVDCGITLNGSAYCWGNNSYGQLGIGNVSDKYEPIAILGDLNFSSIEIGLDSDCSLLKEYIAVEVPSTSPAILDISPDDLTTNITSNQPYFFYTPRDNESTTLTITLYINQTINATNFDVANGTATSIRLNTSAENGNYAWTIMGCDGSNCTNTTERTLTLDLLVNTAPEIVNNYLNTSTANLNNYTSDTINVYAQGVDNHSTSLMAYYNFYNETTILYSEGMTNITNGTLSYVINIVSTNTKKWENHTVELTLSDKVYNSTRQNRTIMILNSPLNITSISSDDVNNITSITSTVKLNASFKDSDIGDSYNATCLAFINSTLNETQQSNSVSGTNRTCGFYVINLPIGNYNISLQTTEGEETVKMDWLLRSTSSEPTYIIHYINTTPSNNLLNYTDDNLFGYAQYTDNESDSLMVYNMWYNGTTIFYSQMEVMNITNNTITQLLTLDKNITKKYENWTYAIRGSDKAANTSLNNFTIMIRNAPLNVTSAATSAVNNATYTNSIIKFNLTSKDIDYFKGYNITCSVYLNSTLNITNNNYANATGNDGRMCGWFLNNLPIGNYNISLQATEETDIVKIDWLLQIANTAPSITGLSPADLTTNTTTRAPYFFYTPRDNESTTLNVTLYINQTINATNFNVANGTATSIQLNSSAQNGNYAWIIMGCDGTDCTNTTERTLSINISSTTPLISLISPIPVVDSNNKTFITKSNIEINLSAGNLDLDKFVWNWNNTNYSLFDKDLMLMMNFENLSSIGENASKVIDVSKYRNNGTVNPGAVWTESGKYGGAYTTFYISEEGNISVSHSSSLTPTEQISVAVWIYPNLWRTYSQFILKTNSSSWSDGYGLGYLVTTNKIHFWVNDWNAYNVSAPINLNTWNYVVGTFNGSLISIYVDGALVNTKTHISTINYTGERDLTIGGNTLGSPGINTTIDELRIYNRSLSSDEIKQMFISNLNKYNSTQWYYYTNQTSLTIYDYNYSATVLDTNGNESSIGIKTVYSIADTTDYYDDRKCTVFITADDCTADSNMTDYCTIAARFSELNKVILTMGVMPLYKNGLNQTANDTGWAALQTELDKGFVSIASHSATHQPIPYGVNLTREVNQSRVEIVNNLTLPWWDTFNGTEYIVGWIMPYGPTNTEVRSELGNDSYLIDRSVDAGYTDWVTWDSANGLFNRTGPTINADAGSLATLNSTFNSTCSSGGIYGVYMHPWSNGWNATDKLPLHWSYIGNRTDVWYVGMGELYSYHYVQNRTEINISLLTENNVTRNITITIPGTERTRYGLSYPITYKFSVPMHWSNVYVFFKNASNEVYTPLTEKTRSEYWIGIDAYRKNISENRIYISKSFPQTSNTLYLNIFTIISSFNGTNFSTFTSVNLTNISNLVLENNDLGKINFSESVDLGSGYDLDAYVNISNNSISINTNVLPNLNKSANLSLYNLTFINPRILRDGVICPSTICTKTSYSGGTLIFSVTGFSKYSAEETTSEEESATTTTIKPSPSGGSSSSYGGGSASGTGLGGVEGVSGKIYDTAKISTKLKEGISKEAPLEVMPEETVLTSEKLSITDKISNWLKKFINKFKDYNNNFMNNIDKILNIIHNWFE